MNYSETLLYLYDRLPVFHQVGSLAYKPGLDNTIQLMNALENPHTRFRSIHIAGTNGKGSVSHLLASVLQEAGYKVGLYTSPHLVDFGERIRVNGRMIEQGYVIDFVANNQDLFSRIEPSFFEATMAMAFNYFADCKVDIAIIEVGLGGRLDSTNIINPILSVITNISFDHVGYLGDTLAKIAHEKAGIIKPNTPIIIGEVLSETRLVFEDKARQENAAVIFAEEQLQVAFERYANDKMVVKTSDNEEFCVGLCGLYQLKNIATTLLAIRKLKSLDLVIEDASVHSGLKLVTENTGLQGRWQTLQNNPKVVADTGHNVGGIQYVVEQLKAQNYDKLHIVIGMVNDKDISSVLALLPLEAEYYFTQAQIVRAIPADELEKNAKTFGLNGCTFKSVNEAVECAIANANVNDFVFIGGSNFVVGEALSKLNLK
jgi:dihydrofolate synthase/folylpolyglutamate synthase